MTLAKWERGAFQMTGIRTNLVWFGTDLDKYRNRLCATCRQFAGNPVITFVTSAAPESTAASRL
mgnify:FL=1